MPFLKALGIDDPVTTLFTIVEGLVSAQSDKKERLLVVKSTSVMMAYILGEVAKGLQELPEEHRAMGLPIAYRMLKLSRAQHVLAAATSDIDGDLLEQIQAMKKMVQEMDRAGNETT